ncbi:MAG: reverse transcriptase domain-containing protein [Candidatus Fonsibacter sp.]
MREAPSFYSTFEAAFPSISRRYLLKMLSRLNLPEIITRPIAALYQDCRCWIKVAGTIQPGFNMTRGVRQGCPLSPLLFVLVVVILLRNTTRSWEMTLWSVPLQTMLVWS